MYAAPAKAPVRPRRAGQLPGNAPAQLRALPNLSEVQRQLAEAEHISAGATTAGNVAAALEICRSHPNARVLSIIYDHVERYA